MCLSNSCPLFTPKIRFTWQLIKASGLYYVNHIHEVFKDSDKEEIYRLRTKLSQQIDLLWVCSFSKNLVLSKCFDWSWSWNSKHSCLDFHPGVLLMGYFIFNVIEEWVSRGVRGHKVGWYQSYTESILAGGNVGPTICNNLPVCLIKGKMLLLL